MIACKGTHVIVHGHKHGRVVYRCTLSNARRLVDACLADEAQELMRFVEQLAQEQRAVRTPNWLINALADVREMAERPTSLQLVWHGSRPSGEGDPRPMPCVTPDMQDELILFCFRNKINLDALTRAQPSMAELTTAWNDLKFLEPARTRIGREVWFVEEHLYRGSAELKVLKADRWKDTSKEENIVANYYCPFLNDWAMGNWSVEALQDA